MKPTAPITCQVTNSIIQPEIAELNTNSDLNVECPFMFSHNQLAHQSFHSREETTTGNYCVQEICLHKEVKITCMELRLSQGILCVTSSHSITPKLYTSDLHIPGKK